MNRSRTSFLIVASSLSILCLIALQLYWVNISLQTQQEQFDQNVMTSMQEAIKKLEKEEAITKVTSQLLDTESFDQSESDTLLSQSSFPLSTSFGNAENGPVQPFASVQGNHFKLNIEIPNPQRNDSSTFIMRETQKRVINSRITPAVPGAGEWPCAGGCACFFRP